MVRKSHARKSYRSSKRTKRRVMRKTSVRKAKKSRQVVKKKRSRKKSKKVTKGGYGCGKTHKGGGKALRVFYQQFLESVKPSQDMYRVTFDKEVPCYYFESPGDSSKQLIVPVVINIQSHGGTMGTSEIKYRFESEKSELLTIVDLFYKYVKVNYHPKNKKDSIYLKNTIDKLEISNSKPELISKLKTLMATHK